MSKNIENKNSILLDILYQEDKLEEESAAILGGSDAENCTYNQGYVKRQVLYSCLTCCPKAKDDPSKSAGVCLACSYKCHKDHKLIELYTKRNFRCDCPTKKFGKCLFVDYENDNYLKYIINTSNMYNNNFGGTYCFCKRPYPDPQDTVSDEMLQCVICEDWFHTRHLECSVIPKPSEYGEMICGSCIAKNQFLKFYAGFAVNKVEKKKENVLLNKDPENNENVVKEEPQQEQQENGKNPAYDLEASTSKQGDKLDEINKGLEVVNDASEKSSTSVIIEANYEPSSKIRRFETPIGSDCKMPAVCDRYTGGALFWPHDWRFSLCTCFKCKKVYTELKVMYLLNPEDTIAAYEEIGMKKQNTKFFCR